MTGCVLGCCHFNFAVFVDLHFVFVLLFTATTTPSREGAGISVIPGAEVQGKPECQEGYGLEGCG